ncbi:MAG: pantoate--beta-alanine ligase [Elusimicrobia bacterium]|nr:pantoate--beta-alanine ligase [Elusimicrobiota bacterium]MBK8126067.1 pantoate--beta-alanine ligase [Elusimicrobiota bacterium]MBK8422628.1 pantoate--beta-alanine ligase [Elusimicrobiota bacterium]MBK9058250.1 pantoate--beta-alanine ligase [Elusimicrobiota bacterium]MBP8003986.1 pantoate--beta-alanine ligase [Elusimicrobiota bacterium]
MKIVRSARALQALSARWRGRGETIGFVPTLGALHEGHRSLVRRARRENKRVVVSVFVNPTQFGPREDLARYPRPFRRDLALCRAAGVDAVFAPSAAGFYPPGFQTWVTVEELSQPLCGPFRPGHFRGVATVVLKLLNAAQPHRAYFGEKDFQQLRVVERLVRDLDVPVRVVPCPTVREQDGLALSSRNRYLTPAERRAAPHLRLALRTAAQVLRSRRNAPAAERAARAALARGGLRRIQYVSVVEPRTLRPWEGRGPARIAAAIYVGRTRLIDNRRA